MTTVYFVDHVIEFGRTTRDEAVVRAVKVIITGLFIYIIITMLYLSITYDALFIYLFIYILSI